MYSFEQWIRTGAGLIDDIMSLENKNMASKPKKKKETAELMEKKRLEMLKAEIDLCKERFYLVGITGRTSFILQNINAVKFKITIGNQIKCSCNPKESRHCIHTIYVLTEIFYLPLCHPLLSKSHYTNKQLRYIIASRIIHTNKIAEFLKYTKKRLPKIIMEERDEDLEEEPENMCAICQMQIVKRDSTVVCEEECQNTFHIECFAQWAKHEVSEHGVIKCPLCRDQKPAEYLKELKLKEYEHLENINSRKVGKQFYYYCDGCQLKEIQPTESVYKCMTCEDVTLCATCFNVGKHIRHSFIFKNSSQQKWRDCEDRKTKKKMDDQAGLIRMKLPNFRRLYQALAASLPCYFSKNTRWNIVQCKKLDIKIEELECIACPDKQKAFLRRMPCGHFIHHRCLRRRIEKGRLFCKVDGQKFLLGYDSLLKHEKLNKNVEKCESDEQSEQEQKCMKHLKLSPTKSLRSETQSSDSRRKIKSVKSVHNRSLFASQSFHNPE